MNLYFPIEVGNNKALMCKSCNFSMELCNEFPVKRIQLCSLLYEMAINFS